MLYLWWLVEQQQQRYYLPIHSFVNSIPCPPPPHYTQHPQIPDQIPADCRIVSCVGLASDEGLLTGESHAVSKNDYPLGHCQRGLAPTLMERRNMIFFGCVVARGRGTGVVVATGMQTELGKVAHSIGERPLAKTQLQKQLEKLALGLFLFALVLGVIVVGVNGFNSDFETISYATALAVAMIPESLVSVVTLTMAIGVKRLAAANTFVRRLTALEALGTSCLSLLPFLFPSLPFFLPPSPCFLHTVAFWGSLIPSFLPFLLPSLLPSLPLSLPPSLPPSPRDGHGHLFRQNRHLNPE